jgi:hypothetical protein
MEKYIVNCTKIYNGFIEVEAESKEDALELANEKLGDNSEECNWSFGEMTVDYADAVID